MSEACRASFCHKMLQISHTSLRSLERYIAENREAAKRKARTWERRQG